jgi:hypothetical protein
MPFGAIHIIIYDSDPDREARYYCGIEDAIAAIYPVRLPSFPRDAICVDCLRAYEIPGNASMD